MKSNFKKLIALFLTLVMLVGILPVSALAESLTSGEEGGGEYYTVTFKHGSDTVATQYYAAGSSIEEVPEVETQESVDGVIYTFIGWFTSADGTGTQITAGTAVDADITAYACYAEAQKVTITLRYYYDPTDPNAADVELGSTEAEYVSSSTPVTVEVPATFEVDDGSGDKAILAPAAGTVTFTPNQTKTVDVPYYDNVKTATIHYIAVHDEDSYVNSRSAELCTAVTLYGKEGNIIEPEIKNFSNDFAEYYKYLGKDGSEHPKFGEVSEVYVYYLDGEVTITYNTMGGSYVEPKTGKYGDDIDVCDVEETEGHTHTAKPTSKASDHKNQTVGCYTSQKSGSKWNWVLTCTLSTEGSRTVTPTPTRTGYTFGGWFLDEGCTQSADNYFKKIDGNKTVYAKWISDTVSYTLVYQREQLTADYKYVEGNYSYIKSVTMQATAGSTVSGEDAPETTFTNSKYYHLDPNQSTEAVVKADGSTVVYATYALNVYTIAFNLNDGTYGTKAKLSMGGSTYTTASGQYTFQARLDEDIADKWPTGGNFSQLPKSGTTQATFYGWDNEYVSKRFNLTSNLIKDSGNGKTSTFTATWKSGTRIELHYMLQNADDDGYTDSEQYRQTAYSTGTFNPKPITGFTNTKTETKTESGILNYYFYYKRDTFSIDYYYNSTKLDTKTGIRFGKNINTSTYTAAPARPSGLDPEATFAGWYENAEASTPYNFTVMPASNLVLYAKWAIPEKTVTFVYNNGDEPTSQTVTKNTKPDEVAAPTRDGYIFTGWFEDEACTRRFDFNKPVTGDITVYAGWKQAKIAYSVRYVKAGTGEELAATHYRNDEMYTFNQLVTEAALSIYGYRPDAPSKSINLQTDSSANVITFVYSERTPVDYYIKYVTYEDGAEVILKDTEHIENVAANIDQVVCDAPAKLTYNGDDYYITNAPQTMVLSADSESNVITFIYLPYQFGKLNVYYVDENYAQIEGATPVVGKVLECLLGHTFSIAGYQKDIEDYEFQGFRSESKKPTGENQVCTEEKTIYALYKAKEYTLTIHYVYANGTQAFPDYTLTEEKNYEYSITSQAIENYTCDKPVVSGKLKENTEVTVTYTPDILGSATVTTRGGEFTYDGQAHGATVTVTGLPTGYTWTATSDDTATNVGTVPANCDHITIKNGSGKDVTANITLTYVDGSITIKPAPVTITVADNEKYYGDNDPEFANAVLTGGVGNELAAIDLTVSRSNDAEDAGTYENVLEISKTKAQLEEQYKNYTFTVETGDFTIKPKVVTVKADDKTKTYGDSDPEFTATVTGLPDGATISYDLERVEGENVGTYTITPTGETTQGNYTVVFETGTLSITRRAVTVKANNKYKTYGEADPALDASVTGLMPGDSISYSVSRQAGEDVGRYPITPVGAAEQGNYTVSYVAGILTINPKAVVVQADDASKVYGEDDPSSFTATVTDNVTVTYTISRAPGENVGTYTITPTGAATQGNYTVTYRTGTFTITKAELTVTADDRSKVFGADDPEFTATVSGLVNGDDESVIEYTVNRTSSNENVGIYEDDLVPTGPETLDNYNVTYVPGDFEITKAGTLTVSGTDYSGVYDGSSHGSAATANITEGTTIRYSLDGERWVNDFPTITNVGSITVYVEATNPNYDKATDTYTLTVTPRTVTVTAVDDGKVYGTADPEAFTATVSGTLNGDTVAYRVDRTAGEDAGTYPITPTGDEVQGNYAVTYVPGTFTISPAKYWIVTDEGSKIYDGTALTAGGEVRGLVGNETATVATTGSQINVGQSDNTYGDITWGTANPDNYEHDTGSDSLGKLIVTAKQVTVTADDKSKKFGETDPTLTATIDGLVGSDTVTYELNREAGEDVGEYTITPSGAEVQGNYSVTYAPGTLTITKAEITITVTGNTDTKTYNGSVQSVTGYALSCDSTTLYDKDKVGYTGGSTASGTAVTVGDDKYEMGLDKDLFTYDDSNIDATFVVIDGWLKIIDSTEEIIIETEGGTKTYDGTALAGSIKEFTVPEGYTVVAAKTNAEVTHVSEGAVTVKVDELSIHNANGDDVTDKLNIRLIETATVEIKPIQATVTANSDSKAYDGTALTNDGFTCEDLLDGDSITVTVEGSQTDVGSSANKASDAVLQSGTSETTDYDFEYADGTLTVTAASVTVTAVDNSKVYNTDDPELTATVSGLFGNDTITYDVGREDGEDVGEYAITPSGATTQGNYTVSYVPGTFTITPAEITITVTENGNTVTYTGSEQNVTGYTLACGSTGLYLEGNVSYSGTDADKTAKGTNAGSYDMGLTAEMFSYDDDNIAATFVIVDGQLVIEKAEITVTVTENSGTATYDAGEHTVTGYSLSCDDDLYVEANVSYSGTDANKTAKGTNAGSYDMGLAAEMFSYDDDNIDATFEIVDGQLVISPKAVTVTAENKSKTFGENDPELTATVSGALNGDTIDYSLARAEGEAVGEYAITPTGQETQGNYTVTFVPGTLTITAAGTMTVVGTDYNAPYDGAAHGSAAVPSVTEGTTVSYSIDGGTTWTKTVPQVTNVADSVTVNVKAENPNYTTATCSYTLTVTPVAIEITAKDAWKQYDGEPLTFNAWEITSGALVGNDAIKVTVTGTITNAGTEPNVPSNATVTKGLQSNYSFSYVNGNLEVRPADGLVLYGKYASKTYDGLPLRSPAWAKLAIEPNTEGVDDPEIVISYRTSEDEEWSTTDPSLTNVGKLRVYVKAEKPNYKTLEGLFYELTVTPAPVTVKANPETKVYGDSDPAVTELSAIVTGLVNGESESLITYTLSIAEHDENAGIKAQKIVASGEQYQGNYEVTYVPASLTITPKAVVLTVADATKVYGESDPAFSFESMVGQLEGDLPDPIASVYRTNHSVNDVGVYEDVLDSAMPAANLHYKYPNYTFTIIPGTFTITKAATMTVSGTNYSGIYDSESHGEAAVPSVTEGTTVSYSTDGGNTWSDTFPTITDVGEITVNVKAENPNYEDATCSYTLKVTPKPVTITVANNSKVFGTDDPTFALAVMDGAIGSELSAIDLTVSRSNSDENVGTYEGVLVISSTAEELDAAYTNYTFTVTPGNFQITKAGSMTVEGKNYTGVYDGETHGEAAVPSVTEGTTLSYNIDGTDTWFSEFPTIKDVGTKKVNVKAVNPNYETATCVYTLTVTPMPITITVANSSKVYGEDDPTFADAVMDEGIGTELTGKDGIDLSVIRENDAENVGTYTGVLNIHNTVDELNAQYPNYTFTVTKGNFEITKSNKLTVKGKEYSGVYDGQFHGEDAVPSITEGTTLSYTISGDNKQSTLAPKIKDVGTKTVTVTAHNPNYADATDTYTLTVTKRPVVISIKNSSKVYGDNDPAFENATMSGQVEGELTDIRLNVIRLNEDETVGTYADVLALIDYDEIDLNTNAKYSNYTFTVHTGAFEITKRPITITADDRTEFYSGSKIGPLEDAYQITAGSLAFSDKETVTLAGGQSAIGTYENELSVDTVAIKNSDNEDVSVNYEITRVPGTLRILSRSGLDQEFKLNITANGGSYMYNGNARTGSVTVTFGANKVTRTLAASLGIDSYGVDFDNDGTIILTYNGAVFYLTGVETAGGALTNVGRVPVMRLNNLAITDSSGADVTDQFAITAVMADLEVTPRPVTLMSATDAKNYDGTPLTNHNVTVGQYGFVPGEGATYDVTGTVTGRPGVTTVEPNYFTYKLNANTNPNNYTITVIYGNLTITPVFYTLTIHYLFEDGTTAHADYVGRYAEGVNFKVVSPAVEGYTPNAGSIADVMPNHDLELTVYYTKDAVPKDYTIEEITDEPVPRAELEGDHVDGILPFLITLITFIGQLVYNKKRKKYQEEIFDLQKKLIGVPEEEEE